MRHLIFPMKERYEEYVIDESKYTGYADSISFPENEAEILEVLKELRKGDIPVTIQGGKTGINGGAVPKGGHIMNLSHMNHVTGHEPLEDGSGCITVEPGINLMDLKKETAARFRKPPMFWPVEPTEESASVGGIISVNARGISSLRYGAVGNYVKSLRVIDYAGQIKEINWKETVRLHSGTVIKRMDTVLGKEGITGIISGLTLKLIPKPESMWGIAFFFNKDEDTGHFTDMLRAKLPQDDSAQIAAVEYIDRTSIDQIEIRKSTMPRIKELPDIRKEVSGMIYIEVHGLEKAIEAIAEELMELAMACNSDPDEAWAVCGEPEVEKMRSFRHKAAETANLCIEDARKNDQRITKLETDMVRDNLSFGDSLLCIRKGLCLAGLTGCIFGHALDSHQHVNILPKNYVEYQKGIETIRAWAREAQDKDIQVTGGHGVGKLTQEILGELIPRPYVTLCRELKLEYDRKERINKGNICFDWKAGA